VPVTHRPSCSAKEQLLAACEPAEHWLQAELERTGETRPDDILRTLRAAIDRAQGQPRRATTGVSAKPPRSDSKQARMIEMLRDGASISEMASELGWLRHTCHGALAGLKKRGIKIVSDKQGGERIYRQDCTKPNRQDLSQISGTVAPHTWS
jgi:hypothetical protein